MWSSPGSVYDTVPIWGWDRVDELDTVAVQFPSEISRGRSHQNYNWIRTSVRNWEPYVWSITMLGTWNICQWQDSEWQKNNNAQDLPSPGLPFRSMVVTTMGLVAMLPDHVIHLYIYVVMGMPLHSGICRSDLVLHHDELNISIVDVCVQQSCNNLMHTGIGFFSSTHTSHQQQFLRSRNLCCKVNQSMFSSSSSSHVTHHFGWVFFVDYLMKPQFSVYRNWDFCLTVSVNLCLQQKLVIWSFNPQFASYQRSSKKQLTLWSRASDSSAASPTHI